LHAGLSPDFIFPVLPLFLKGLFPNPAGKEFLKKKFIQRDNIKPLRS
jgi:hypothetical protein